MTAKGAIGTTPSSVVRGPGVNNWNLSLFKNLRLRERLTAQFRAEAYNAFSHTKFNGMNTSAQFGQITGARDPRAMQFALHQRF